MVRMISSWKPRANQKHTGLPEIWPAVPARLSLSRCGGKDGLLSGIFFLNSQIIKSYKYYQISGDIFGKYTVINNLNSTLTRANIHTMKRKGGFNVRIKSYKDFGYLVKWMNKDWGFRFFVFGNDGRVYMSQAFFYNYNAEAKAKETIDLLIGGEPLPSDVLSGSTNNWRRMHGCYLKRAYA